MKQELQFKLQAYLDGELPVGEAREVTDLLAQDAEARALLAELKNTVGALAGFESEIKLPESRDFYWSKIERELQRFEKSEQAESPISIFAALRRLLIPAGAVAGLLIAAVFVGQQLGSDGSLREAETETTFADSGAFTYRDYTSGMTLVWLSYPAENEFAEMVPDDTLD